MQEVSSISGGFSAENLGTLPRDEGLRVWGPCLSEVQVQTAGQGSWNEAPGADDMLLLK